VSGKFWEILGFKQEDVILEDHEEDGLIFEDEMR
jgi:hypothetical protein